MGKRVELAREAVRQFMDESENTMGIAEDDDDRHLSRLLSKLESIQEVEEDQSGEAAVQAKVLKEIESVKRQNRVTHLLLYAMIAVTAIWQFSELSVLLGVKKKLSHPLQAVGNAVMGLLKCPKGKMLVAPPPVPPIGLPAPHSDTDNAPTLPLTIAGNE